MYHNIATIRHLKNEDKNDDITVAMATVTYQFGGNGTGVSFQLRIADRGI